MSEQKGLAPAIMVKGAIEDLSGDSENWSGEGTSETLSSSDDKPKVRIPYKMTQARSRLLSRVDTGHEALPTAVPTPISGPPPSRAPLPPPARQDLHRVLVVGDANAKELGRLHDWVDVTIIAKLGASWQNTEGLLERHKHNFHMVLTVLGSNDVPKMKARRYTWEKAQAGIKATLAGLRECLMIGQPASHLFLSAPFNIDPLLWIDRFLKDLREAATEAGASFIPIEWLAEHGDTEAPVKRLNVAGKELLMDSFLRASQLPKPVSGPSSTPAPPQPSPPPGTARVFAKIPTRGSSSSSSSSSSSQRKSSSSHSSSSKRSGGHRGVPSDSKSRPPGGHEAQTGSAVTDAGTSQAPALATHQTAQVCEICITRGHHDSPHCPLVWACSNSESSDIKMVEHAMSKLGKIMPNRRDHTVVVAKTDILGFVQMPSDGNCLFATLVIGAKRNGGRNRCQSIKEKHTACIVAMSI